MPKRLVEGEAIWSSKKLAEVEPPSYRSEYANLLPLAELNGVFEFDVHLIWSTVYAYNRDINEETVFKIIEELARVDMLRLWSACGRSWGYFVGINKPGRLPYKSQIDRGDYKIRRGIPNPPESVLSGTTSEAQANNKLVLGLGIGLGEGLGEPQAEENMSAISRIQKLASSKLGWVGFIGQGDKQTLAQLALAYGGEQELSRAFENWVDSLIDNYGPEHNQDPIRSFIFHARATVGTYREEKSLTDSRLKPLLVKIYSISGQSPAGKSKLATQELLKTYSPEEIILAFSEDYANRDDFRAKSAVKEFFEGGGGEAIILAIRERTIKALEQAKLLETQKLSMTEAASGEIHDLEYFQKQEKMAQEDLESLFGAPATAARSLQNG